MIRTNVIEVPWRVEARRRRSVDTDRSKTFRIWCDTYDRHRIVFDNDRYEYDAPDHDPDERLLGAFSGRLPYCEAVAKAANVGLCTGTTMGCHSDTIAKHVRNQAKRIATEILRTTELPTPHATVVALQWHASPIEGLSDRDTIIAEPTALALVEQALVHFAKWHESEQGRPAHGWQSGVSRDGASATLGIWDHMGRVILWQTADYGDRSIETSVAGCGDFGAPAFRAHGTTPAAQQAGIANLVLALAQSVPKDLSGDWLPAWKRGFALTRCQDPSVLRAAWRKTRSAQ